MTALAQGAAQNAISSSVTAGQQQAMAQQLTGAQQSGVKRGDTISLEYRLTAVGSTTPLQSATLQGKADNDGQDVLSPLVGQLAGALAGSASPAPARCARRGDHEHRRARSARLLRHLHAGRTVRPPPRRAEPRRRRRHPTARRSQPCRMRM